MSSAPTWFWKTDATPNRKYDVKHRMKPFESNKRACSERDRRVKILNGGDKQAQVLALKLEQCQKGARCGSSICSKCMKRFRRWYTGEMLRGAKGKENVSTVTLVSAKHQYDSGDLVSFDMMKMIDACRSALRRKGLKHLIIMGGVDFSFNIFENDLETAFWQAHLQIVMINITKSEIRKLRQLYPVDKARGVLRPVKVSFVEDRALQFSYTCKSSHFARSSYINKSGRRNTRCQPLKAKQLRELLVFLDQYKPVNLLFLQKVKREGSKIINIPEKSSGL